MNLLTSLPNVITCQASSTYRAKHFYLLSVQIQNIARKVFARRQLRHVNICTPFSNNAVLFPRHSDIGKFQSVATCLHTYRALELFVIREISQLVE